MSGAGVLVMAKAPVPGRVKTRLCPPCTPRQAAALAAAALEDTLENALGTPGVSRVLMALDGEPGRWCPSEVQVFAQRGRGLAARLAHAWSQVPGPALQVGMDTPQAGPELLARALESLEGPGTQAVLGLAGDGGWWCIGFRRPRPEAFAGVPMGSSRTGAAQLARLEALGLAVRKLAVLTDVDRFDDALEVGRLAPGSRFAATLHEVAGDLARPRASLISVGG